MKASATIKHHRALVSTQNARLKSSESFNMFTVYSFQQNLLPGTGEDRLGERSSPIPWEERRSRDSAIPGTICTLAQRISQDPEVTHGSHFG